MTKLHTNLNKIDTHDKVLHKAPSKNFDMGKHKFNKALKEYEELIMGEFMNEIYQDQEPDAITGGGFEEKIWTSFLTQEYAKKIAEKGDLNLTSDIRKNLSKKYNNDK
ncbi:MAG: hypothetical protein ACI8ZF_000177 [Candidatus Midichloriaceae bacterium]|jgi:hypothetical protein